MKKKKKIKDLGPEQPDLHIEQQASDRGRSWLDVMSAMPCFVFLVFFFKVSALKFCGQLRGLATSNIYLTNANVMKVAAAILRIA